jgi:hypothetical protein
VAAHAPESGPTGGRRTAWLALLAILLVAIAGYGVVARERLAAGDPGGAAAPGEPISAVQAEGTSLVAVGRVEGLPRACTAWLLDVAAAPEAPAHAVTAGRCLGIEDTATVLAAEPVEGASVVFAAFAPATGASRAAPVQVEVEQVAWASMRGVDLAVLRLADTYGALSARGVRPIAAAAPPGAGAQLLMAGVPIEGLPEPERTVRGVRCSAGEAVDLVESPWFWPRAQSSDCTGFLEGSTGSPVLDPGGRAVGMAVTSTVGAESAEPCYEDAACAVGAGQQPVGDVTYLTAVAGLASCFPDGTFRTGGACPLEDPAGVVAALPQADTVRPGGAALVTVEGRPPGAAVRWRIAAVGEVDCSDPQGWRASRLEGGTLTLRMPVVRGFVLACVGSASQPTPIVLGADAAAPDAGEVGLVQREVPGGVLVRPTSDSGGVTGFRWTSGPSGSIDCATAEGWVRYRGQPALVEVADLPMTVCVVGLDDAGNATAPVAVEVSPPGE